MMTPEQRRKFESQMSPEDRSIANVGRLAKAVVLGLMVFGLSWLGAGESTSSVQQAAAPASASSTVR